MPEELDHRGAQAIAIPQTGAPTWAPPLEDDNEAQLLRQQFQRDWHLIFVGRDGLRAGWSILTFLSIVFAFSAIANFFIRHVLHHKPGAAQTQVVSMGSTLVGDGLGFLLVAFAAFLVSLIEKRRFGSYGIGGFRTGQFVNGSLWGAAILGSLVVLLHVRGLLVLDGVLLHGVDALKWALLWLLGFLCVGLFEDFLTRGFLQVTLARGLAGLAGVLGMGERGRQMLGFWLAVLLFSIIFGLGHGSNPGESPIGLVSAGLIGFVFAFSLWRTGSLWWAIGYHMAWDWMQSFVFGVADSGLMMKQHLLTSHPQGPVLWSGGATGPEGSVFVLAECVITGVVIWFALRPEAGSASWRVGEGSGGHA